MIIIEIIIIIIINFSAYIGYQTLQRPSSDSSSFNIIPYRAIHIPYNAKVVGWRAYLVNTKEMYFQIWRPITGTTYTLVGQSFVRATVPGVSEIKLTDNDIFDVRKYDLMGFTFLSSSALTCTYLKNNCPISECLLVKGAQGVATGLGSNVTFRYSHRDCRIYSLQVIFESKPVINITSINM